MPVTTRKVDGYENRTPGGVKGKHMTKANAEKQANLLRAIEHNPEWKPTEKPARKQRKVKVNQTPTGQLKRLGRGK